jgi:drug/metabolite transporter (DMT)-like permease
VSRRGWILFAAMCIIWGIPYLLIKVAVEELAPATLVLTRTGVVLGYAIGPIILARRLSDQPGLGVVASSLLLAALVYLPLGVAQAPREWPSGRVLAAVLTLSLVCTALAFLVFFQLIAEVGSGRATVITYINPAVAVLLGVLVLDERFTVAIAIGFVLVLAGSVLATSRPAPTQALEPASEPASEPESASVLKP